ncbi:tetratricopeptide repeat protein [Pseudotabrizicola sp. L79]|uniref:tetratricopeptide repeat protein n=1 Tax=Pseudotabrizicola sp. L79 TaxID=3118402 RepID=UPI002F9323E1
MTYPFLKSALALVLGLSLTSAPVAAQSDDGDPGAYLAARISLSDYQYRDAAYWFTRALLADEDNTFLLEGLVLAQIGQGDFALAAEAADRFVALNGRGIAANIALLVRDVQAGDYAGLLAAPPERSIGNLMDKLVLAWAEFGQGKMSEAVTRFDEISATDGLKPFGLYHKALALAAVGDFGTADKILSGEAAGPLIVNRRGVIAHAQILSQLERPADALALLDRSFGNEPEPELMALRAALVAGQTVPFDAVRTAQDGMAEVLFSLAIALNGEAEPSYTLLYAAAATALRPDHTEAVLLNAGLLEQLGQQELAAEAYGRIPPDHPAFYTAELGRISTLFALERKDEGLAALQALSTRFPDLSVVQMSYGDALRREERFAEAAAAYTAAINLVGEPEARHWGLFYARAVAHERAGMWDQAEPDFRKALALNPDQPQVLNYLGYSFVDQGTNLDEALELIERAVALRPDAGYIIDSLAWAYFRLGRYQDALEPMERASLLEPVDPVVTDHLGDVYWAVGRQLEARFQWRRALSFDPEEKDATRIRRKLEIGLDAVLVEEGAPPLITAPDDI